MEISDATLRVLIDELVVRAAEQVPVPKVMPGTVTDGSNLSEVMVVVDGDADSVIGQSIIGAVSTGERVMVMFNPPSGMLIFGRCPT